MGNLCCGRQFLRVRVLWCEKPQTNVPGLPSRQTTEVRASSEKIQSRRDTRKKKKNLSDLTLDEIQKLWFDLVKRLR